MAEVEEGRSFLEVKLSYQIRGNSNGNFRSSLCLAAGLAYVLSSRFVLFPYILSVVDLLAIYSSRSMICMDAYIALIRFSVLDSKTSRLNGVFPSILSLERMQIWQWPSAGLLFYKGP